MPYDIYLDKKIIFKELTKEQAEDIQVTMQQMIMAGIKTDYTREQIRIELSKP